MIVPAPIPRSENVLAEFTRFATHIHNRNVMTGSYVCKLMQHIDMTVCECVISGVRVEHLGRENVRHIVNKASVQASTITGLIQLACLAPHDSLHLRTHLQLLVSVLIATVPLNMRGDRGCLFTHYVQTIAGIRKETMMENIGSVLRIYASLTARLLWWRWFLFLGANALL